MKVEEAGRGVRARVQAACGGRPGAGVGGRGEPPRGPALGRGHPASVTVKSLTWMAGFARACERCLHYAVVY